MKASAETERENRLKTILGLLERRDALRDARRGLYEWTTTSITVEGSLGRKVGVSTERLGTLLDVEVADLEMRLKALGLEP